MPPDTGTRHVSVSPTYCMPAGAPGGYSVSVESEDQFYGRVAYEAYCKATDYKSAITGDPLPGFYACPEPVRNAWIAAAQAVRLQANLTRAQG